MGDTWHDGELLGFDLETTGVRRHEDVPVSFALVQVVAGQVAQRLTRLVDPGREIPAEAVAIHQITTERARAEGMPLEEALAVVLDALLEASRRGVPVVGMNLSYDLSLVDHQLRLATGEGLVEAGWEGPVLDVLVLDRHLDRYRSGKRHLEQLCAHYAVVLEAAHEAAADAEAAVLVLLALCTRFPHVASSDLAELTLSQAIWHRQWAEQYGSWLRRQGRPGLSPLDHEWPLARLDLTSLSPLGAGSAGGPRVAADPVPPRST